MAKQNNDRNAKREKFTEQKSSKGKQIIIFGVIAVLIVGFAMFKFFAPAEDVGATSGAGGNWQIGNSFNYGSASVEQTVVKNTVENGKVKISKADVQANKIVYTEYVKGDTVVPLTAFINTKGRVVVAFSMCEPCKGTRFHIQGDNFICNTCGATWKVTNFAPVSGAPACLKYPPEEMNYDQDTNSLILDESKVAAWKPRV